MRPSASVNWRRTVGRKRDRQAAQRHRSECIQSTEKINEVDRLVTRGEDGLESAAGIEMVVGSKEEVRPVFITHDGHLETVILTE